MVKKSFFQGWGKNYAKALSAVKALRLSSKLNIHLGIYEAKNIILPKDNCELILGTHDYRNIIFDFVKGFCLDCFPDRDYKEEEIDKMCIRHIGNKSLYLLRNAQGEIVSMAGNVRGSINGGTVSLVFTPLKFRSRGYGSLVTAKISEKILKQKKFANLFTNMTNPTSNSIYQKIGYTKIGENIHYDFN